MLLTLFSFTLRCAATLAWFRQVERIYAPDSHGYERLAINLIEHKAFSQSIAPPLIPDTHRTPIYPLFIGMLYKALGKNPLIVALAQDAIDALTSAAIYAAALWASSHTAGIIASLLYAIAPLPIFQCQRMLTETLFIFFSTSAALAGLRALMNHRPMAIAMCGFLLGIATLTRPAGIGITLIWFVALAIAMHKQPFSFWLKSMAQFAVSFALPLIPWLIRNFVAFKMLSLCTGHQLAFAYYNAAATLARAKGISIEQAQVQLFNDSMADFKGMRPFKARHPDDVWQPAVQDPKNVAALVKRAKGIMLEHPFEAASVHIEGFIQYLFMTLPIKDVLAKFSNVDEGVLSNPIRERIMKLIREGRVKDAVLIAWNERISFLPFGARLLWLYSLLFALFIEGMALGTVRAYTVRSGITRGACLIFITTSLYFLLTPGPQLEPRFRAVAEPWLILLSSIGIASLAERRKTTASQQGVERRMSS